MSVTFTPDTSTFPVTWGITCYAEYAATGETVRVGAAETYEGGREVRALHLATCSECQESGCFTSAVLVGVEAPEVNVSNGNAWHLAQVLGLDTDDLAVCGSEDAEVFLARVLMAQAVTPADQGSATVTYRGMGGARIYDCGREAGYTDRRLAQVLEVAEWAVAHGVRVTWG